MINKHILVVGRMNADRQENKEGSYSEGILSETFLPTK